MRTTKNNISGTSLRLIRQGWSPNHNIRNTIPVDVARTRNAITKALTLSIADNLKATISCSQAIKINRRVIVKSINNIGSTRLVTTSIIVRCPNNYIIYSIIVEISAALTEIPAKSPVCFAEDFDSAPAERDVRELYGEPFAFP